MHGSCESSDCLFDAVQEKLLKIDIQFAELTAISGKPDQFERFLELFSRRDFDSLESLTKYFVFSAKCDHRIFGRRRGGYGGSCITRDRGFRLNGMLRCRDLVCNYEARK